MIGKSVRLKEEMKIRMGDLGPTMRFDIILPEGLEGVVTAEAACSSILSPDWVVRFPLNSEGVLIDIPVSESGLRDDE